MGLFDRFGAGGGDLEIHPHAIQVAPGQRLTGSVRFVGGKRPQQITKVTLKLLHDTVREEKTPNGLQTHRESRAVCPELVVATQISVQPGQSYEYPFELTLPVTMVSSVAQVSTYRLAASADIDNEIDPGASKNLEVVGGVSATPGAPGMPGVAGAMPGMMPAPMGAMSTPVQAPIGIGSPVLAQWQDGRFHPARVVAMQPGQIGVDYDAPELGGNVWLAPHQVQPMPTMAPMMSMSPALAVGMPVHALAPNGATYGGHVVQLHGEHVAVAWDDPALGAPAWVSAHAVRPR